jgi:hypothetical protein
MMACAGAIAIAVGGLMLAAPAPVVIATDEPFLPCNSSLDPMRRDGTLASPDNRWFE